MSAVDDAERALGVELMPWQRKLAEAVLSGERLVYVNGRRGGFFTVRRVVEAARSAADSDPTVEGVPGE